MFRAPILALRTAPFEGLQPTAPIGSVEDESLQLRLGASGLIFHIRGCWAGKREACVLDRGCADVQDKAGIS